jgi:hypothetical protein
MRHNRAFQLLSLSLAILLWLTVKQSLERGEGAIPGGTIAMRTYDAVRVRVLTEPGSPTEIELEPSTVSVILGGRPNQISELDPEELEAYVRLVTGNSLGRKHPVQIQVPGFQVVAVNPQEVLIRSAAVEQSFQTTTD